MAFGDGLSDITPFLQQKYAIQKQQADASTTQAGAAVTRANSGAAVDYANAGQIAPDAVAKRALSAAQTGLIGTEVRKANALQPVYDYQGQSPERSVYGALGMGGLWGGGAGPYAGGNFKFTDGGFLSGSTFDKSGGLGSGMVTPSASSLAPAAAPAAANPNLVTGDSLLNRASPSMARGIRTSVGLPKYTEPQAYAKGTSKVPGKTPKSGNTDIVPAKLTPGEAVLNKGAAEHVGRGLIDHLNAIGMAKMGMPEPKGKGKAKAAPKAAKGAPQAFAEGTSNVQPYEGSHTLPGGIGLYVAPGMTPDGAMQLGRNIVHSPTYERNLAPVIPLAQAAGDMNYLTSAADASARSAAASRAVRGYAMGTSNVQPVPTTTSELMLGYPEMMPMLRFGAP